MRVTYHPFLATKALFRSGLTPVEIAVASFLFAESNKQGVYSQGQDAICKSLELSPMTIKRAMKRLQDTGWCVARRRLGKPSSIQMCQCPVHVIKKMNRIKRAPSDHPRSN
jgi:hypothetical protein